MSYDLMVFSPESAPRNRADFMEWYEQQTNWEEEHSYDDPIVTTPALRSWFLDMIVTFPAMNGPYSLDDETDDPHITGYSIGKESIYIDFRWSVMDEAYDRVISLAKKHQIGFFDASGDAGDIMFPDSGDLIHIDKREVYFTGKEKIEVTTYYKDEKTTTYYDFEPKKPWWKFW